MMIIGLTGSIAMGKSTVAGMFADMGIPVFDADACVRDLINNDTKTQKDLRKYFKTTDRSALGKIVFHDDRKRKKLESILHPRVANARKTFLKTQHRKGKDIAVLDIPLLFETGLDKQCNISVVVTAPAEIQVRRAMQRDGMTKDKFRAILKTQMPDHEKRARADFVIYTHMGLPHSAAAVRKIVNTLRKRNNHA